MREILFRGKHVHELPQNEHLDGKWIEGYLADENHINSPGLEGEFLVDPETVCQYTSLIDSTKWEQLTEDEKGKFLSEWNYKEERQNVKEDWHGRKIFEGDICKDADSIVRILWNDKHQWGVEILKTDNVLSRGLIFPLWQYDKCEENGNRELEVIGNIFDNPELIGELQP